MRALFVALALAVTLTPAFAATAGPVRVADGVYVLRGTGGDIDERNAGRIANVTFVVGPRGIAVFDTGISYREGEDVIAAVRTVSELPIRLAVLTHPSQEAIFGAAAMQDRGIPVLAHRAAAALIASRCDACLARLRQLLGERVMASTRVVVPDRTVESDEIVDTIGRRLRVIAPPAASAPGAIAILDEQTSTLIAGSLVSIRRVPDLRDADEEGWKAALSTLEATHCRHLVPAYGPPGRCTDIASLARYLDALESRVQELLRQGVSLIDVPQRAQLQEFEGWDAYSSLHPANASRTYLRLERGFFR